jgi:hypothetical protein
MTDRAKKITELDALTTPVLTDLLIIEDDPSGTPVTKKITVGTLLNSGLISSNGYAIANTTVSGVVKIGDQLSVNATGFLNTNLNVANASALGVMKIGGDQFSINATSFLTLTSIDTLTANNTLFVGSVSAVNVVSNSQLTSNLSNYALLAGASFTGNIAGNTAGYVIGYRDIPQNFTNTSMTLALTDAGKHILTQNSGSSTQTITIANNATVEFQTGAAVTIVVQSTGTVAVANGAGVTMYLAGNSTAKSTVTLNSYSMATLLKIGTDTWMVSGTGAT